MDLPLPPTAPATTDNPTVILWVVGVLMFALFCLVYLVYRWVQDGRNECKKASALAKAENDRAWDEVAKRDAVILKLTAKSIEAQHASAMATDRLSAAIVQLSNVVRGSGSHRTQT